MGRKALITGIAGQDAAYLATKLLEKGYQVFGILRKKEIASFSKLDFLNISHKIEIEEIDLINKSCLENFIKKNQFDEIYNLAAQSSVSYSLEDPYNTIFNNTISVLNLLESIRLNSRKSKLLQAGSCEIYNSTSKIPINENSKIDPRNPYALSKANAYFSVKVYRNTYKLFASNAILFNHESVLRNDSFFIKKVIKSALEIHNGKRERLFVGNLNIKRDYGYAPDFAIAMHEILNLDDPSDFIVSTGRSISLNEIVNYVFRKFNIPLSKIVVNPDLIRKDEVEEIVGCPDKLKQMINWQYEDDFIKVLDLLIEQELNFKNGQK